MVSMAIALVGCMILAFLAPATGSTISASSRAHLQSLPLDGALTFESTTTCSPAQRDIVPAGVVYPSSVADVATVVGAVARSESELTVAARGLGHNIWGRSQAENGIIVEMTSMKGIRVAPLGDAASQGTPFVEVKGGELWEDVLKASLEHGMAPRSWTDYLHLTVGGTLSNGGVSGQTFRHGPQVSNVLQLQVVTGTGAVVECSPAHHRELFFAVLGGLGQFGIITSARILLEKAPQRVRWMRALYTDFATFKKDQEMLIGAGKPFDFVEGFVVANDESAVNGWGAVPFVRGEIDAASIPASAGTVMYCLEVTKAYSAADVLSLDRTVERMLAPLSFHRELFFETDTTYVKFLERVQLRAGGEWELPHACQWSVPHPWLNVFVPASAMESFDHMVFKPLAGQDFNGQVLVYPVNKSKWDERMSVAVPEGSEEVFYVVAMLRNKVPEGSALSAMLEDNAKIVRIAERLGGKQYLPKHADVSQWKRHFGARWEAFVQNKEAFDPRAILAPGQNIFARSRGSADNKYIRLARN